MCPIHILLLKILATHRFHGHRPFSLAVLSVRMAAGLQIELLLLEDVPLMPMMIHKVQGAGEQEVAIQVQRSRFPAFHLHFHLLLHVIASHYVVVVVAELILHIVQVHMVMVVMMMVVVLLFPAPPHLLPK